MGQKPLEAGLVSHHIARLLRARKEELAISDYLLAERSGVPRERLRRAMVGERPFLVDDLDAVARALGLVPWHVVREAEKLLDTQPSLTTGAPGAATGNT